MSGEGISYMHMYFKKYKKIIVCSILMLFCTTATYAQQTMKAHVFAHNKGKQNGKLAIELKWFTQKIESGAGVYIYRQEVSATGWLRINDRPLVPLSKIDSVAKKKDEELIFFEQLLKEKKASELEGLVLLSVWIKAFQSNDLARFMGIYYKDSTVVEGKSYRYKIVQLLNGAPKEIGITAPIKAMPTEQFENPVQEIKLTPGKKTITFLWKEETLRFWSVNVYRRIKGEAAFVKVNQNPVMINRSVDSMGNPIDLDRFYEDDSLQENTTYEYQLSGVDFFGYETQRSASMFGYIKDLTAPARPHLKLDSVYLLKVYMNYTPVADSDIKGYYLYRSTTSEGLNQRLTQVPFNTTTNTWVDDVPEPSPYYYFISAMDTAGNETPSERIIANVEDVFEPEKPLFVSAKGDTGMIRLTWKANDEPDLWGYYVYRGINGSKLNTMVLLNKDPYTSISYTDTINKAAKNTFFYAIRAVDSSYNRSVYSDTLRAAMPDIIPPAKPYIKSVIVVNNQLQINWIPNYEKDLKGYRVYTKDTVQKKIIAVTEILPSDVHTYTFKPTESGPLVLYLRAIDITGNESEYSVGFAYKYKPVLNGTENQSLILDYKNKNKKLTFTWNYSGTNTFKGYVLYVRADSEKEFKAVEQLQQKNNYQTAATSKANGMYEVRIYFNDGTFLRSKQITIIIK